MNIVVGLGNPGEAYSRTRHNLGFLAVEHLAAALPVPVRWKRGRGDPPLSSADLGRDAAGNPWRLLKPLTFMNESGGAVWAFLSRSRTAPSGIWIVHDDVDLPEGTLREAFGSGSAGHRGVASVIDALGTRDFHRLRIGVGRPPHAQQSVEDFVLEPAPADLLARLAAAAAEWFRMRLEGAAP